MPVGGGGGSHTFRKNGIVQLFDMDRVCNESVLQVQL